MISSSTLNGKIMISKVVKICLLIVLFIGATDATAQQEVQTDTIDYDSKYREDQFYIGVGYNLLLFKPQDAISKGLSGSMHFGFLRDMPLNERRNISIAMGLGASFNEYGSTLFIGETLQGASVFTVLDEGDIDFDRNGFSTAVIEVPFELRWRSSAPETYKFWRVYTGFRLGYAYWYKATFKQGGNNVDQTDIPEFNPVRLSATLSFGYNTVNFFAQYSLNPFFDGAVTTQGETVNMLPLKLGFIFYIL
jgi:hypothetical protein